MGNVLNTAYKVVADVIESEENINIEQGTLHVIDDKLKVHLEGEIKEVSTKSYKVYTALLTQSGTDAPVATVLENTIGNIVWSREQEGIYKAILTGAFTINKTFVVVTPTVDDAQNQMVSLTYLMSLDDFTITTTGWSNSSLGYVASDGQLYNTPIEIRVYN